MPFFSVIIPVYNKAPFIENTIKSVLEQQFDNFELILVNDGSTDDSEQIIHRFSDARIRYYLKKNEGASSARNYGIELSTAPYIAFLDADDYWYPDFLSQMKLSIELHPNHKIFSAAYENEIPGKVFPAQYSVPKNAAHQIVDYFEASMKTSVLWTSSAVFSKTVFEQVGVFDTQIKSGQDTDLWMRLGLHYPIVFSWKILARYTYDGNSLSKQKKFLNQKMNFDKFKEAEKTHEKLKKFIDQNLFSFAIRSKINGDLHYFTQHKNRINTANLSFKKRVLLQLPSFVLRRLIQLNLLLVRVGLQKSVF
ncbi:glycosyltransferase family 2 protein [Flavobacterium sp. CYK-55]|uniref:glycosyltransferase family 2 protein n=1 Tax=Flavobacterium sp. CYK-55 TaxID=2835529 RepID=UPI001BCDA042|nr:glycosyltransferase family A protein [Flavobacterium sp. CYK-55]MBS7788110.1 glycosyltransferase family 2 protein [Flavobacterium sp. CYK-55]